MNQRLGRVWPAGGAEEQNKNERERSDSATELWHAHNSSADAVVTIGFTRMARKAPKRRMAAHQSCACESRSWKIQAESASAPSGLSNWSVCESATPISRMAT